jgi:hypothetical protein
MPDWKDITWDHTFQVNIYFKLSVLLGVSTHVALYTMVNEFEQCRSQALTLTKSLS